MVLVFQHGWGKGCSASSRRPGIDSFLPIFMFVILFGLSMDYHVFILSRIREAYDRGMSTDEAIAHGITTTAGVVTSAAIVMVCVFSVFATLSMLIFKQFGVGLAAAILIDATIVRAVLLPAAMKLLGDWNWYLPSWLEWLPHLEQDRSVRAVQGGRRTGARRPVTQAASHVIAAPPRSALLAHLGTETAVARAALGVIALHVADDSLLPAGAGHVRRRPPGQRPRADRADRRGRGPLRPCARGLSRRRSRSCSASSDCSAASRPSTTASTAASPGTTSPGSSASRPGWRSSASAS